MCQPRPFLYLPPSFVLIFAREPSDATSITVEAVNKLGMIMQAYSAFHKKFHQPYHEL
jgi:hypothetical protein